MQSPTICIYSNAAGTVSQCNTKNVLILDFKGNQTLFKITCFFGFRKKINSINFCKLASDSSKGGQIEIITHCGCERVFVLTPKDALALRDLLNGAKVMLELNSIIRDRLLSGSFLEA